MVFHEIKTKYPDILTLYKKVQELTERGYNPELAVASCRKETEETIRPEHRQEVSNRLLEFAWLVKTGGKAGKENHEQNTL